MISEPAALVWQRSLQGNDLSAAFSRNVTFFSHGSSGCEGSFEAEEKRSTHCQPQLASEFTAYGRRPLSRRTHRHTPRMQVSPCSSPMRNLEQVMKMRWAEVRWVSSGVRTVRNPHADAERRRTFSPPILEQKARYQKQAGGKRAQPPRPKLKCSSQFSLFSRANFPSNLFSSSYR